MMVFVQVVVFCLWFIAVLVLGLFALFNMMDGDFYHGLFGGAVAIVLFAGGVALSTAGNEPSGLCARGHQEWQLRSTKVWVCDEWADDVR